MAETFANLPQIADDCVMVVRWSDLHPLIEKLRALRDEMKSCLEGSQPLVAASIVQDRLATLTALVGKEGQL